LYSNYSVQIDFSSYRCGVLLIYLSNSHGRIMMFFFLFVAHNKLYATTYDVPCDLQSVMLLRGSNWLVPAIAALMSLFSGGKYTSEHNYIFSAFKVAFCYVYMCMFFKLVHVLRFWVGRPRVSEFLNPWQFLLG